MTRVRSLIVALIVALAACDDSQPIPYTPSYDPNQVTPIPEVELCPIFAQNACATLRPCCAPSPFAFDETKCRAVVRATCEARKAHSHDQGLIYDDVLGGRCAAGFGALVAPDCTPVAIVGAPIGLDPLEALRRVTDPRSAAVELACLAIWHGSAALGTTCTKTDECIELDGRPVLCGGSPQVCREVTVLHGGEKCTFEGNPSCQTGCVCGPGLSCNGGSVGDPVCAAARLPDGATCTVDNECGADRRCACPPDVGSSDAGSCSTFISVCEALPGPGETCWSGTDGKPKCAPGSRCDHDKSACVAGRALGNACAGDEECASRRCDGVCIPGGVVDPRTCSGVFDRNGPFGFFAPPASTTTGSPPP